MRDLAVGTNGGTQHVEITVQPLDETGPLQGLVMIVFTDVAAPVTTKAAGRATKPPTRSPRIAELEQRVEELTQLVVRLKEQLERNSRNSGKPPSGDSPEQRAERRGKGSSGGKRGGQPGHSGSKRELLPVEQVSEFKNLFPPKCESCWLALPPTPGKRSGPWLRSSL